MKDETICPKCGAELLEGRPDCPRCGLVASKAPQSFDPVWGTLDTTAARIAKRLAQRLENSWNDRDKHRDFVEHCRKTGRLDLAIRYYRFREREHPGDGTAETMLNQLEKLVEITYLNKLEPRKKTADSNRFKKLLPYIIIFAALGIAVWIIISTLSRFATSFTGV